MEYLGCCSVGDRALQRFENENSVDLSKMRSSGEAAWGSSEAGW
eukprot:COSAG05_NODE_1586_length_4483_cov_100.429745_2_plen_44_part_00